MHVRMNMMAGDPARLDEALRAERVDARPTAALATGAEPLEPGEVILGSFLAVDPAVAQGRSSTMDKCSHG